MYPPTPGAVSSTTKGDLRRALIRLEDIPTELLPPILDALAHLESAPPETSEALS